MTMKTLRHVAAAAALGALALTIALPAAAAEGDVIRRGTCSGASDWKLKLSDQNGRIEVEYEVDQNVVGDTWRVRIRHNGDLAFRGRRTTTAPSGSFDVRIVRANRTGDDIFRARAVHTSTGEVCLGRARWTA